jgi:hypothetical protein
LIVPRKCSTRGGSNPPREIDGMVFLTRMAGLRRRQPLPPAICRATIRRTKAREENR